MTPALLAALGCALAYAGMQVLFKRGSANASPLALAAWLGLLFPVWAGTLAVGLSSHLLTLNLGMAYIATTALWALLATLNIVLLIALIQRLSLTGLTAYRKAFTALIALAFELYLGQTFNPLVIGATVLILGGAVTLSRPSSKVLKWVRPRTPPWLQLAWVFGFSVLFTAQVFAYQHALAMQPDLISHVVFAKCLMAFFSLFLWLAPVAREHPLPIGKRRMLAIVACFVTASLLEAVALRSLAVSLVITTSFLLPALFAAHDLWHRDLPRTRATWLSLAAIFAGFALLALTR